MTKRVLHLTLKRKHFDAMVRGEKNEEYREIKPYWVTRLEGKTFDEVLFMNGYGNGAPSMRRDWLGLGPTVFFEGKKCYCIKLGPVRDLKNCPRWEARA